MVLAIGMFTSLESSSLITFEWVVKCSKSEVITSLFISIYRFCEERYDYTVLVP